MSLVQGIGHISASSNNDDDDVLQFLDTGYFVGTRRSETLNRSTNVFVDNKLKQSHETAPYLVKEIWQQLHEDIQAGRFHVETRADYPPGGDRGIGRFFYRNLAADPADVPVLMELFGNAKTSKKIHYEQSRMRVPSSMMSLSARSGSSNNTTQPLPYWTGPYNIRVSNFVNAVTAADGGNLLYKNGQETELGVLKPLSKRQYLDKYTVVDPDGIRWWKE